MNQIPITIELKNIGKTFKTEQGSLSVFEGISLTFFQGKTYAITGVSGTGKSTLLQIIAGLDEPTQGEIFIDGNSRAFYSTQEISQFLNVVIGIVFQQPLLIKELSVIENIMLKGLIAGTPYNDCRTRAYELLTTLGLDTYAHYPPRALSGGQQQRVALARALFNQPHFLLADELTSNLDEKTAQEIIDFLLVCQKKWNLGLIMVTHNPRLIERLEERYLMAEGVLHKAR